MFVSKLVFVVRCSCASGSDRRDLGEYFGKGLVEGTRLVYFMICCCVICSCSYSTIDPVAGYPSFWGERSGRARVLMVNSGGVFYDHHIINGDSFVINGRLLVIYEAW